MLAGVRTIFSDTAALESRKKSSIRSGDEMPKRGSPAVQVFIVIAVVGAFLYGFYCYHDQHKRLKRSEESGEKLKQKTESLSAQLQGKVSFLYVIRITSSGSSSSSSSSRVFV